MQTLAGITQILRAMFEAVGAYTDNNRLHIAIARALLEKKAIPHK